LYTSIAAVCVPADSGGREGKRKKKHIKGKRKKGKGGTNSHPERWFKTSPVRRDPMRRMGGGKEHLKRKALGQCTEGEKTREKKGEGENQRHIEFGVYSPT